MQTANSISKEKTYRECYAESLEEAQEWLRKAWEDEENTIREKWVVVDVFDLLNAPKEPIFIACDEESAYRRGFTHGFAKALELSGKLHRRLGFSRTTEIVNILENWFSSVLMPWRYRAHQDCRSRQSVKLCGTPNFSHTSWYELRQKVFARDRVCVWCGSDQRLECDHIIPVSEGGLPTLENLQTLCVKCHRNVD